MASTQELTRQRKEASVPTGKPTNLPQAWSSAHIRELGPSEDLRIISIVYRDYPELSLEELLDKFLVEDEWGLPLHRVEMKFINWYEWKQKGVSEQEMIDGLLKFRESTKSFIAKHYKSDLSPS